MGLTGLKSRFYKALLISEGSGENSCSCFFLASRGRLHSLPHDALPSSKLTMALGVFLRLYHFDTDSLSLFSTFKDPYGYI